MRRVNKFTFLIRNTRTFGTKQKEDTDKFSEVMYGRRNRERDDSLTTEMLEDRLKHKQRIGTMQNPITLLHDIENMGHGRKKRLPNMYTALEPTEETWMSKTAPRTRTGAGGLGVLVGTATQHWPIFKHMLPEIAFAGHSNSGKSTLVNSMIGKSPRGGIASVSPRAGWTDQIHFYQLGKKPPLMTLVDLPGYGHAVAVPRLLKAWKTMNKDYMKNRLILSRVYVLVDSMRGICEHDKEIFSFLEQNKLNWKVILTKCDHLSVEEVAKSSLAVYNDILKIKQLDKETKKEQKKKRKLSEKEEKNKSEKKNETKMSEEDDNDMTIEEEKDIRISTKEFLNMRFENTLKSMDKSSTNKSTSTPSIVNQSPSPPKHKQTKREKFEAKKATQKKVIEFLGDDEINEDQIHSDDDNDDKKNNNHLPPHEAYVDEDQLTNELSFADNSSSQPTLTDDGEILGGFDIDYHNLSPELPLYKEMMKQAQFQLDKQKILRDQEIIEKGRVDYEIIDVLSDSEDEEYNEDEKNEGDEENNNDDEKKLSDKNEYLDANISDILKHVIPVSATTGAGITAMWKDIKKVIMETVIHPDDWENRNQLSKERIEELNRLVREHKRANEERKRVMKERYQ